MGRRTIDSDHSAGAVYDTKFLAWESRAAVRAKPRRVLEAEWEEGKLFFPPELTPVASHPLVAARGTTAVADVLLQRLHVYLDFTAELEQMAVNPVTQRISRRRLGFELPERMIEDAYKICTDEAWHAQFSDDLQRQLTALTGKRPIVPETPRFFARLLETRRRAAPEVAGLAPLLFTIVSETLISAILAGIPRNPRIVSAVRELVADHAQDEGRHHAFFSAVFARVWPQLSPRQKRHAGPMLADFVTAFLEPDREALVSVTRAAGLSREEALQVVEEAHPPAAVAAEIRRAAHNSLRLFARYDVFEDPATVEAFAARGLVGPDGAP
jgi:hypothetical protein